MDFPPLIALGVHARDLPTARQTLAWCARLGPVDADILLMIEGDLPDDLDTSAFRTRTVRRHAPLEGARARAAVAVNLHHHIVRELRPGRPFFMWEADAIPLCAGWYGRIVEAHGPDFERAVSGTWVNDCPVLPDAPFVRYRPFLNGVALYPARYDPLPLFSETSGSDCTNNAHHHPHLTWLGNRCMAHRWGAPPPPGMSVCPDGSPTFPDRRSVEWIRERHPDAVLFHRCKDGSLIERLREAGP